MWRISDVLQTQLIQKLQYFWEDYSFTRKTDGLYSLKQKTFGIDFYIVLAILSTFLPRDCSTELFVHHLHAIADT